MNSLVSIFRNSFSMKFALSKKTFQLGKFAYRERFSADLHLSVESAAKFLLEWILCWICEEIRSIRCVAWPLRFYDFFLTFGSKISSCENACPVQSIPRWCSLRLRILFHDPLVPTSRLNSMLKTIDSWDAVISAIISKL